MARLRESAQAISSPIKSFGREPDDAEKEGWGTNDATFAEGWFAVKTVRFKFDRSEVRIHDVALALVSADVSMSS